MGLDYEVISDTQTDIYGEFPVTELTLALAKERCSILSLHEHDESLENYYINLVGGDKYE